MKKKMLIGVVLIIALLVAGCASTVEEKPDFERTEPTVSNPGDSNLVEIEKADPMNLSEEAQKELEERRNEEGSYVFTDNDKNYLAVFAGVRNTGGYDIEIIEVVLVDSELMVSVEMMEPGPDMVTTQALTYPMDLVELINIENIGDLNVSIELENIR
jgi:hypothetical protein